MATLHCLGGRAMLETAARAAEGLALVGVTVLTSHDAASLASVLGRPVPDVAGETERLARLALSAGLRGVVASGHEVMLLRRALGSGPWIVVPGVRREADPHGDQSRTVTPAAAVMAGATHLVVGRSITHAADPAAAFRDIRACA
jgi:orotidine-5'-phosphate decarboxylase